MNRIFLGALAALLFVSVGLFWLQGRAQNDVGAPPPDLAGSADKGGDPGAPEALPSADVQDLVGPAPPEATELTREQIRFGRYDRDRDGRITRHEMMSTRTDAFKALDKDGNYLLTFEEWAVATSDRFAGADANGDGALTPREFATTRPKRKPAKPCKC